MRSFTKSLGRFSWALSLLGLGSLADIVGRRQPVGRAATAAAAFDSATGALERDLPGTFRTVFRIGDRLFGGLIDLMLAGLVSAPGSEERCGCGSAPDSAWPGSYADPFGTSGAFRNGFPPGQSPPSSSPPYENWGSQTGYDGQAAADSDYFPSQNPTYSPAQNPTAARGPSGQSPWSDVWNSARNPFQG